MNALEEQKMLFVLEHTCVSPLVRHEPILLMVTRLYEQIQLFFSKFT
jgi:hypothetical protein